MATDTPQTLNTMTETPAATNGIPHATVEMPNSTDNGEIALVVAVAPPKRPRGRPPKNQIPPPVNPPLPEAGAVPAGDVPLKRSRGRPRKNPLPPSIIPANIPKKKPEREPQSELEQGPNQVPRLAAPEFPEGYSIFTDVELNSTPIGVLPRRNSTEPLLVVDPMEEIPAEVRANLDPFEDNILPTGEQHHDEFIELQGKRLEKRLARAMGPQYNEDESGYGNEDESHYFREAFAGIEEDGTSRSRAAKRRRIVPEAQPPRVESGETGSSGPAWVNFVPARTAWQAKPTE